MNLKQKKGRTAAVTIDDLLQSKRWQIAIKNYEDDPMFMRAILIELAKEAQDVARYTIIKAYTHNSGLAAFEMGPYLRSINEFNTYNIWWGLSDVEQLLYIEDPQFKLSPEKRSELLQKVKNKLMG